MKRELAFIPIFLLSGCSTIANWADDVGKHIPTIGEPCHHWQCVTGSGQEKSEENKKMEEAPAKDAREPKIKTPKTTPAAPQMPLNNTD